MADLHIQVCYAESTLQIMRELQVREGTTVQIAIDESGIKRAVPEIDLALCRVGIYGKLKTLDTLLRDQDRIEIYRPLLADPKESRRRRVTRKK